MQNEELKDTDYNAPLSKELNELAETSAVIIPVTPNNPPWNSFVAFAFWLVSIALIIFMPVLFILPYAIGQGVNAADSNAIAEFIKNDPTTTLLNLAAVLPAHFLTLLLAWFIVTGNRKFSFRETLGWSWGGFKIWHCLAILGGFFIIAMVVNYYSPEQDNDLSKMLRSSRTAALLVAFIATFTAPLVEEVIYRGVLYSAFQRTFGVPVAVFAITFLFAVVHVPQYYPSYSTIFLIGLLSLTLTLIRVRTGNLLPCIVLHTVFNGIQSLLLIAEPYLPSVPTDVPEQTASIIRFLT